MLTRWDDFGFADLERPFSALTDLRREMDRLFYDFERGLGAGQWRTELTAPEARSSWPRMSMQDTGNELRLRAEVPGVSEKDLSIAVEMSSLTIRGQRQPDVPEGYSIHRQERGALTFARSFTLPCRVDAEKVTAHLKNGILDLTLPKVPEERPKQIQVRVS
jgi:HSP20 family protein